MRFNMQREWENQSLCFFWCLFSILIFFLCMGVLAISMYTTVYPAYLCLVLSEAREGYQIPQNWSYTQLWSIGLILRIWPISSVRSAATLNLWVSPLASVRSMILGRQISILKIISSSAPHVATGIPLWLYTFLSRSQAINAIKLSISTCIRLKLLLNKVNGIQQLLRILEALSPTLFSLECVILEHHGEILASKSFSSEWKRYQS